MIHDLIGVNYQCTYDIMSGNDINGNTHSQYVQRFQKEFGCRERVRSQTEMNKQLQ